MIELSAALRHWMSILIEQWRERRRLRRFARDLDRWIVEMGIED